MLDQLFSGPGQHPEVLIFEHEVELLALTAVRDDVKPVRPVEQLAYSSAVVKPSKIWTFARLA